MRRGALAQEEVSFRRNSLLAAERLLAGQQLGRNRQRTTPQGGLLLRKAVLRPCARQFQAGCKRYRSLGHKRSLRRGVRLTCDGSPFIRREASLEEGRAAQRAGK